MERRCAVCAYWDQAPTHDKGWCGVAGIVLARTGFSGLGPVPTRAEGSCPFFEPAAPPHIPTFFDPKNPPPPKTLQ
ncbi:MAG: hypothetical protein AB7E47_12185 [Desulfovibrionaceae bacterium]